MTSSRHSESTLDNLQRPSFGPGRQRPHVDDGGMDRRIRSQKTYDHRLKDLVHETGDIQLAVQRGVPRSTARGWLCSSRESVVTLDVLDSTKKELEHEVLMLRRRNEILCAVLRVLVVALKLSGFSLANCRVPDSAKKAQLLRAVERSRSSLPLRAVLRVLRVSPARYHSWKRSQEDCVLDDRSSCPKTSPHQLTSESLYLIAVRGVRNPWCHHNVHTGQERDRFSSSRARRAVPLAFSSCCGT